MTDRFGIVACSKSKRGENVPDREFAARDLYDSWLFDSRVAAVEAHCDEWAVMSAEHGYVDPDDRLTWYDRRIDELPSERRAELARDVVEQIPDSADEVMVLMGRDYFEPLSEALSDAIEVWDPLKGVGLFEQRSQLRDLADATEQATLVTDGGTEIPPWVDPNDDLVLCHFCGQEWRPTAVDGFDLSQGDEYYPNMVPVCPENAAGGCR